MEIFIDYIIVVILFLIAYLFSKCFAEWSDAFHLKRNAQLPPQNSKYFFVVKNGGYISLVKIYHFFSFLFEYGFLFYVLFFVKWWFSIILLLLIFLTSPISVFLFPKTYNIYQNGGYFTNYYWIKVLVGFFVYPVMVFLIIFFSNNSFSQFLIDLITKL